MAESVDWQEQGKYIADGNNTKNGLCQSCDKWKQKGPWGTISGEFEASLSPGKSSTWDRKKQGNISKSMAGKAWTKMEHLQYVQELSYWGPISILAENIIIWKYHII